MKEDEDKDEQLENQSSALYEDFYELLKNRQSR